MWGLRGDEEVERLGQQMVQGLSGGKGAECARELLPCPLQARTTLGVGLAKKPWLVRVRFACQPQPAKPSTFATMFRLQYLRPLFSNAQAEVFKRFVCLGE